MSSCRWDEENQPTIDNLVLMTFDEAEAHETAGLRAVREADPDFAARVERTLRRVREHFGICGLN